MKQVWGLGAAVLSLLLIVLFWTVYVTGRLATTERLAPSETFEGIEVPVIGTVGDFPEPERRVVINVTMDGRIVIDGATYTMGELVAELKRRAELVRAHQPREVDPPIQLSDPTVVLRVHEYLPWACTQQFILVCAESSGWRLSFAVRHEGDFVEGAVGIPLPTRDLQIGGDADSIAWQELDLAWADQLVADNGLHGAMTMQLASGKATGVRLHTDPDLPTYAVLGAIDAAVRAGMKRIDVRVEPIDWRAVASGAAYEAALERPRVQFGGGGSGGWMPALVFVRGEAVVAGLSFSEAPSLHAKAPAPSRPLDEGPK